VLVSHVPLPHLFQRTCGAYSLTSGPVLILPCRKMKFVTASSHFLAFGLLCTQCGAQTFQRLGACPKLGCIFPPDQVDFLPGQYFDIRVEVHAPINGSEVVPGYTSPDTGFTLTVAKEGSKAVPQSAASFFNVSEPKLEQWNFTWYEDLFAQAAHTPSLVKVAAKAYRHVALYEPGQYIATLTYQNGSITYANWTVRDIVPARKAKNVVLFIGDGMTTNMITGERDIQTSQIRQC